MVPDAMSAPSCRTGRLTTSWSKRHAAASPLLSLFGSGGPEHEGIPINKTPIFEPLLVIKDPLPPSLGSETILYPLPVDLGIGVIADPLPSDLGTNIQLTPLGNQGPIINADSDLTWQKRAAKIALYFLLLFGQGHSDVTQPGQIGKPETPIESVQFPPAPEQQPGQGPDPNAPDPDATAQP